MRPTLILLVVASFAAIGGTVFLVRPHLQRRQAWAELVACDGRDLWKGDPVATRAFESWSVTASSPPVIHVRTLRRQRPDERLLVLRRDGDRLIANLYLSTGLVLGVSELAAESPSPPLGLRETTRPELPGTSLELAWEGRTQIYALQNGALLLVRRQDAQGRLVPGGVVTAKESLEHREHALMSNHDDDVLATLVWLAGEGKSTDFVGRSGVGERLAALAKSPNPWIAEAVRALAGK